jgi:hypothetical protein
MMDGWEKKRVLMVVKTYPAPSEKYQETVCTAGVTDKGEWIRLYPITFRYLDKSHQFEKYSWIDVETQKSKQDMRPESYKAIGESIIPIRKLDSIKDLEERKKMLIPLLMPSYESIEQRYTNGHFSLGIFQPKKVLDFVIEPCESDWTEKQRNILDQTSLFENQSAKHLEKIPWDFSYRYLSESPTIHKQKITDWEAYQAFRKFREYYDSESMALQKLKEKYMGYFTDPRKESYLIVGTVHPFPTFIVIGVFSFKREIIQENIQTSLFNKR